MRRICIVVLSLMVLTAGCGKKEAEVPAQAQTEEQTEGLANPWKFDVSAEEAEALSGTKLNLPEGAFDVAYNIMESEKMAEMTFSMEDGTRVDVRVKPAAAFEDISGIFYEWDTEITDKIGSADATIRIFSGQDINSVLWHDGERMYALYTEVPGGDGAEALRVARIVYGAQDADEAQAAVEYDMYGYVVDKLPEDQYYNHYNVKGDNDEIFIANYNGTDELTEGTYVGLFQIGDGWTLEVIDDGSKSEDKVVVTDENGIMLTDMQLVINTPETCQFEFTLKNPSGKEAVFDQTRITLENYDGTELYPFGEEKEPLDASAQLERHSFTMDIGNIKNGDEISVYYDGSYVTSLFVTGGPKNSEEDDLSELKDFFENIDMEEYTKMILEQAKEGEKQFPVKLEKKDSSKDVQPIDGGLFITADEVECRSLKLSCPGEVFSFGVELYNNTGSDKTFDQTKFVIEKEEGVYLNPFVFEEVREPETVSGEMKRLWMAYTIYDPRELKIGDEVSVYYDGVFITKLTVEK